MSTAISKCQYESATAVVMSALPREDCALALGRLDGILEKLKLFERDDHEPNFRACYHRVVAAGGVSACDMRDYKLLINIFSTPNGRKVAAWRDGALRRGESCAEVAEAEYPGDEKDAETRRLLVDRQLGVAAENGFNFLFICNILFHEVGVDLNSFAHRATSRDTTKVGVEPNSFTHRVTSGDTKKVGVDSNSFTHRATSGDTTKIPRFLNRVLGMRLSCQEATTQLFYATLSAVVKEAKRRGAYDLGIRNYSGREVRFTVRVPCLCFHQV